MEKTIRVGIFGLGRGSTFYEGIKNNGGEVVAICDKSEYSVKKALSVLGDVAAYYDFDEFIEHPMDAVILCNYFHEHAPYAIRCLEKNIHVMSECLSNATMAEGVALVRAAEKSSAIYMFAENYPYMLINQELKKIKDSGTLGKILYAEGEYNHPFNNSNGTVGLRPFEKHWRNHCPRTYYMSHSLGPLMNITGAIPKRVTAMPVFAPLSDEYITANSVGDRGAIVTCLNDDDSVFRLIGWSEFGAHGSTYRICGEKGQAENVRGDSEKIMLRYNKWDIPEGKEEINFYAPEKYGVYLEGEGHGGSDVIETAFFLDHIRNGTKPEFDVYFATVNSSVAILAHRSSLERGIPYDIPDFHLEEDRVKYENDTLSPFYYSDGREPTMPCCSHPDYRVSEKQLEGYNKAVIERDKKRQAELDNNFAK